ncbi:Uncharacterized membrane protein YczE [Saccharopolyspora kobensis]|uniref:Uncharacterized membrane protein YczE n=1 Tax=Saccharopolyspora kobensis TaxID=146035 RepID=A0A1H6EIX9_9PSEU|nr:hypothetical protein [Saccharopolyspora kobensis]SEG96906.1 Uncharacterized membrane protein YczE [Saccharopolyspora kobensis]SFE64593.1 Uncharacterized membrane protein YczE [Saccharopolyspora kobensis]
MTGVKHGRFVARRMTAVEQFRAEKKAWRLVQLLVGLVGYGTALTFLVGSALGASAWAVLAEGLSVRSGISFGLATSLTAVVVLLCWIPLRELPGLGTVLNVVMVGAAADVAALFVPAPTSLPQQVGYLLLGVLMLTFFDAVYLGARFGSGPRDGLMTGAVRLSGKPIWMVRTAIELVVLAAGWLLGGTVGVGTVLIALAMGPLVQQFLRFTTVRLKSDG